MTEIPLIQKNDISELDELRQEIRAFHDLLFSTGSLEANPSDCDVEVLPDFMIDDPDARKEILPQLKKYRRLLRYLETQQSKHELLLRLYTIYVVSETNSPAPSLKEMVYKNLRKIKLVERILLNFRFSIRTQDSLFASDDLAHEIILQSFLSPEELQVLESGAKQNRADAAVLQVARRALLRQLLKDKVVKITGLRKRDRRRSYRRLIRVLFKNRNDNSGADDLFSVTQKQIFIRSLNYH
jgi:hypothetical protein